MGLFSFIKGQFIEVIEWLDDAGSMVHRFPAYDNAIKMGAKLVVRESQAAVFVNEGQIADVFGPGTYTLSTQNMPVLTALKSWKYGFNSPFKADVFFVGTANFTDLKWGTTNPIIRHDGEFGIVRLRGFGTYSARVKDPGLFLKSLIGTRSDFTTDQISGFLKSMIVTCITDLLGESNIPIAYLAASYEELSESAMDRVQPGFESMGLELTLLLIENISLPDEVEKAIDRRSAMGVAGDLDQYMKFQTAEAIREAASNPNAGGAGMGAGFGAGMGMAQVMGQMMNRPGENHAPAPSNGAPGTAGSGTISRTDGTGGAGGHAENVPAASADAAAGTVPCGQCGTALLPSQKFCPECGTPRPQKRFCAECGEALADSAKFCPNCGTKV
ncbi:SPFH domain-containing protein [Cohnella zeiphila]|uniref:SPFH domain-containing protein n=1 Tax=Cohnella zeiphila TaxID=2761120 RepID=A0A7X0VW72_9BACL|nr:SPFH domain-containing protein [Cohnella zeiphila]MBB6732205.1 SPFH domain-containing protein [Cohnella zeiphila]